MKKRLLSLVLCLVMVFSLVPAIGMNAFADTPGEKNADGYVSLGERTWNVSQIQNWNVNQESGYPAAASGEEGTLYVRVDGKYLPVSAANDQNFMKQVASPADPMEFTLENWKYQSGSSFIELSTSVKDLDAAVTEYYVRHSDGQYYRLYYKMHRTNRVVWVGGSDCYEIMPYYSPSGSSRVDLYSNDEGVWQEFCYTVGNFKYSLADWSRQNLFEGYCYYGSDASRGHNAFRYNLFKNVSASMIWFGQSFDYGNDTGNRQFLAYSENGEVSWSGELFYKAEKSLIPIGDETAIADGDESETPADNALQLDKKLTMNPEDGTFSITMTSYATGEYYTETTEKAVPADIVLVIDQSGSMGYDYYPPAGYYFMDSVTFDEWNKNNTSRNSYYIHFTDEPAGTYYKLSVDQHAISLGNNAYKFSITKGNQEVVLSDNDGKKLYSGNSYDGHEYEIFFYSASGSTVTRLWALKMALNSFLDNLSTERDAYGNPIHRVAMVGFSSGPNGYSSTEVFDGPQQYGYSTAKSDSRILRSSLKWTDNAGIGTLKQSANVLVDDAGTYSQYGLELAKEILNSRTPAEKENRKAVVVMLTDGEPGAGSQTTDEVTTANAAIAQAKQMKDNGATIFTIGIFSNGDQGYMYGNRHRVYEYMESVSSKYPAAQDLDHKGTAVPEPPKYYDFTTGTSGAKSLEAIFESIETSIEESTTPVTLDQDAILRDIIDTENFTVTSGTTYKAETEVYTAAQDGGMTPVANSRTTIQNAQPVDSTGVVQVSNFNYAANYIGYGKAADSTEHTGENQGKKLIVTVDGLLPARAEDPEATVEGVGSVLPSNVSAAIFEDSDALTANDPTVAVNRPWTKLDTQAYVIDFNAPMILATGLKSEAKNINAIRESNGEFSMVTETKDNQQVNEAVYQLKENVSMASDANLVMSGVDKAMIFGRHGAETAKAWKQINVVPASSVYFDDSLTTPLTVGDGSGRNTGITGVTTTTPIGPVEQVPGESPAPTEQKVITYTFKGTGIDVYCTTDNQTGYIQATLKKDGQQVGKSVIVRCYSKDARYNVPTVSFHEDTYAEYTLELNVLPGANYKLDGVRVYNPMGIDQASQQDYKNTTEANAQYVNLRECLVNDGKTYDVDNATPNAGVDGVLFVDDVNSLMTQKIGEDGELHNIYGTQFEAYKVNGPKHEIYLAPGQAIVFTIQQTTDANYYVGLSAPDTGKNVGAVSVNGNSNITVNSATDMYYNISDYLTFTEDETDHLNKATVKITNTSDVADTVISVTNFKVTSPVAESRLGRSMFKAVNSRAIMLAANNGVDPEAAAEPDPTPSVEPTQQPTFVEMIHQLLSSFVSSLFNSIGRLFGH